MIVPSECPYVEVRDVKHEVGGQWDSDNGCHVVCSCGAKGPFAQSMEAAIRLWNLGRRMAGPKVCRGGRRGG